MSAQNSGTDRRLRGLGREGDARWTRSSRWDRGAGDTWAGEPGGQSWEGIVAQTSDKSRSHLRLCRPLPPPRVLAVVGVCEECMRSARSTGRRVLSDDITSCQGRKAAALICVRCMFCEPSVPTSASASASLGVRARLSSIHFHNRPHPPPSLLSFQSDCCVSPEHCGGRNSVGASRARMPHRATNRACALCLHRSPKQRRWPFASERESSDKEGAGALSLVWTARGSDETTWLGKRNRSFVDRCLSR